MARERLDSCDDLVETIEDEDDERRDAREREDRHDEEDISERHRRGGEGYMPLLYQIEGQNANSRYPPSRSATQHKREKSLRRGK